MNNKNPFLRILPVVAGIVAVALAAIVYINQLNNVISVNTLNTISEMAHHDKRSIEALIDSYWNKLEGVYKRILSYNCKTLEEAEQYLNLESSTSDFTHIYLLAEDGKVYTDKYIVYDPNSDKAGNRVNFLPYFENDEKYIVMRWDDKLEKAGMSQEYVLYGVRVQNLEIEGQKILAIIGISETSIIQKHIILDSFIKDGERRGYCSVISGSGNYIIDNRKTVYLNQTINLFDILDSGSDSELSNDEIKQKMKNSETFSFYYNDEKNIRKLVYCIPFEGNINWYFLQIVDRVAFTEQSQAFVTISTAAMLVIIAVMMLLMFLVMKSHNKTMEANAHAKAQGEFLSNMSHEIRTPLNGLIGLNHLMMSHIDDKNSLEQVKIWLHKSHNTANYLLSLVNDVLDMSKLQAGKADIVSEPVLVESLIDAVHSMQWDNIKNRGVDFVIEQDIKVPCVIGDNTRIKQVLMNIVGNAAKFTPEGGTITLSVSQELEDDEHVTTIYRCTDTGIGMSKEFSEKIFDAFSQERNKNTEGVKGTGLGMAICKLLAQAMGGDVTVESELGIGSQFTVTLPSIKAQMESEHMIRAATKNSTKATTTDENMENVKLKKPVKILVAEDVELNAEVLMAILTEEGFEAVHAENGQKAVEIFNQSDENEFDVILMDMQMPVMDGCTATKEIRGLDRTDAGSVIIFACTANTFKEDRDKAIQSGMNDFLAKPIDVDAMIKKLSGIIKETNN